MNRLSLCFPLQLVVALVPVWLGGPNYDRAYAVDATVVNFSAPDPGVIANSSRIPAASSAAILRSRCR